MKGWIQRQREDRNRKSIQSKLGNSALPVTALPSVGSDGDGGGATRKEVVETSPGGKEAEPEAHTLRVRAEVNPDREADPPTAKVRAKTEVEAPQKAKEKAKRTRTKLVVSS